MKVSSGILIKIKTAIIFTALIMLCMGVNVYAAAAPAITNLEVRDIANNSNGSDIRVRFTSAASETNIASYKIFVVPTAGKVAFAADIPAASALASTKYVSVAKTGNSTEITTTLTQGLLTSGGAAIANGTAYTMFVMSVGSGGATDNLSAASSSLTLAVNAFITSTPSGTDIANTDSAKDIKVTFKAPTDETTVSSYKIFVVPSASVAAFDQTEADANVNGQTETVKSTKVHSIVLDESTKDSTGAAIQNGKTYKIFINTIPTSGNKNLSFGSADVTLAGPVPAPKAPTVRDVANNGTAADISVTFKGLASETNISGYRIFVVPSATAFTVASAEAVSDAGHYLAVAKTGDGDTYSGNLMTGKEDSAGTAIASATAYKVYILAVGANSYLSNMSLGTSVKLSPTVPSVSTIIIKKVEDVNNAGNASDIKVTFKGVKDETNIVRYRVFVVVSNAGLTLTAATTAPVNARGFEITGADLKGNGKTYTATLTAGITNSAGGAIANATAYDIYVLAEGTGNYASSLSSREIITLSASVPKLATPIIMQTKQITHVGNASDIKVSFRAPKDETNIASYQVYIVKSANAATFAGTAVATITAISDHQDEAVTVAGHSRVHTLILDEALKDSDGAAIVTGTAYKIFILSLGQNNYINSLSTSSSSITLN